LVVAGELAWGPPVSMEEGVLARCTAMERILLGAFGHGSWQGRWSRLLSVACCNHWRKMVLCADPSELRWGLKLHRAKALPDPVGASSVDTLGVDYLVEGIVVVFLSPP
jgi:hypothetical protein